MFQIDDYIVYGSHGVCKIKDICHLHLRGLDDKTLYYALEPVGQRDTCVYAPVDIGTVAMRKVITAEESNALIRELPSISPVWYADHREREAEYKRFLLSANCRNWVKIIKAFYLQKEENEKARKRLNCSDAALYKAAKNFLYSEFSVALGIPQNDVEDYIFKQIG